MLSNCQRLTTFYVTVDFQYILVDPNTLAMAYAYYCQSGQTLLLSVHQTGGLVEVRYRARTAGMSDPRQRAAGDEDTRHCATILF